MKSFETELNKLLEKEAKNKPATPVQPKKKASTSGDFMSAVKNTLVESDEYNKSVTENGMTGYRTTGKALVDINFAVSSLRNVTEEAIEAKWLNVYNEDPISAIAWLFFAGDVRGGLGERRLFKTIIQLIASMKPELMNALLDFVPEYTRWDNLFCILEDDTIASKDVKDRIMDKVKQQLQEDMEGMAENRSISLLAKWMPSINTSSRETVNLAYKFAHYLGCKPREYRKMLAALRRYLDVVEVKTSSNRWDEINYETVPSKANLKYADAFLRNDKERRTKFLESLEKGEAKINASVVYPHDIFTKYCDLNYYTPSVKSVDLALEGMWKALPNFMPEDAKPTIVVADSSGSMLCNVANTYAMFIGFALAIYFAERLPGPYKDQFITFSRYPQYISFKNLDTLQAKIKQAFSFSCIENTNVKAVFDLVLKTAVENHIEDKDVPNILIISDMEFDSMTSCSSEHDFDVVKQEYANHGYTLPRLTFWNVNSRTGTIPIKENDRGVALVSGFSPTVASMVMSGETDPYKIILETIYSERYTPVINAAKEVLSK